jgi:hypothetical protein
VAGFGAAVFVVDWSLSVPEARTRLFFEPRGRPGRRLRSASSDAGGTVDWGGFGGVGTARCFPAAVALGPC